jgi:exonuclease SbcC
MNWKQRLFKPKWQHKSADIRLESVTKEQDPDLISSLVEIARTDEDKRVRCAAIKRLHQLENILKLHGSETDSEVKSLLEERIRQLASSSAEARPALNLRMQVVELTSDRDLIEHLASHAPEAELRRAAIAKVIRQGVLGDCCITDSDAENRHFAASRVTQHTTLKRVIEALRKRDKSLHTKLQARLHEELLNQSDPKAIQLEALNICTALEKLALEADTDSGETSETKVLHAAWQDIANKTTADMAERYQRVCERLVTPAVSTPRPSAQPVPAIKPDKPESKPAEAPSTALIEPLQPNESLTELASTICLYEKEYKEQPRSANVKKLKTQLDNIWKQCSPPHQEDLDRWNEANTVLQSLQATLELRQQAFEKELSEAQVQLTQMENELQQGELHKALETRAKIQITGKGHGKNRDWQNINKKMSGMQARLRELRDWHHWSNNKIRKRLIAEMEILPAADLHPDALLDRIKSLQVEWKTLEESEQIPGDKRFSAAPWMWRKFSAAGHTAFDTAKPYLDKRSEIQSRHAQSLATFCAELAQLAKAEPMDWTALSKGLNRGRKKLHDLNNVPANQRQKMARKLKAALDKANAVLQERYQDVEKEKMKLIRAASQLIHMPERSEAITQAKSLQSNWQAAGSLWRSKEQELWNQFREHLDPLFTELKDQQASERAADDERLAAQKALCNELREILKTEKDLSALHGKVQGLQGGWKDIQHPDRKLLQIFQDMVAEYQKKVEEAGQQQVETNRERWWLKSMLLHELTVSGRTTKGALSKKTEARVTKAWPEESSTDELETQMDEVCKDILAGNTPELTTNSIEELQDKARTLCISLEFLAGLPSPPGDRDQRMTYQVDRLAETMSGESTRQPAADEARDAERTWLEMYTLPDADFGAFGKRIRQALTSVTESHN